MTKNELQKTLDKAEQKFIKSKDKIICYPYTLKWKGKTFVITNNKKVLFSTKDEDEACQKFLSFVLGK